MKVVKNVIELSNIFLDDVLEYIKNNLKWEQDIFECPTDEGIVRWPVNHYLKWPDKKEFKYKLQEDTDFITVFDFVASVLNNCKYRAEPDIVVPKLLSFFKLDKEVEIVLEFKTDNLRVCRKLK